MALAEKLYKGLPPWGQNVAVSLYGLKWRNERLGGKFPLYVQEFQERDRWTPSQMASWLEEQLRGHLLRAYEEVPYYRDNWSRIGIGTADLLRMRLDELPKLPVTAKVDLRNQPEAFVSRTAAGGKVRKYYSSGSTGTPITSVCTPDDHRRFVAAREVRSFGWAGVSLRCSRSMIGGRMVVTSPHAQPPYYRHNWAERQTYFSAYHISPGTAANYVDGFNRYCPDVLTGYAQSHYLLSRMMLSAGLRLTYKPRALVLSSEKLQADQKNSIAKAFGARAYEEYGAVENCVLATECEHGSLHVHPDFGIVEILDDSDLPVGPGRDGRVVCTGMLNRTQYLIRYDIGDLARWSVEGCACGRDHLPVLSEVLGRVEDVVVGPDGREMVRFHGIFISLPHVIAGQIIQEQRNQLRVRVVPSPGYGAEDEELIRQRIRERLGSIPLIVEQAEELEKTQRGKVRAVISRLQQSTNE
ncbi:MAG TPA: hypothetical protein VES20_18730 [Bryobacteraceae bacterium]|nr:hypothetical protein [Bryobacteraceae bacterium]